MNGQELEAYVRRRIGEGRELAGFSKREMARRMGIAVTTWVAIEDEKRALDIALMARISETLETPFSWFFPPELVSRDVSDALLRAYPGLSEVALSQVANLARLLSDEALRSQGTNLPSE